MSSSSYPQHTHNIPYSSHSSLNTLSTYIPRPPSNDRSKALWIIYLHGGAWRDPLQDSSTFSPTLTHLLPSQSLKHITGLATINYRLSPYPSHSTSPSNPSDPARNSKHPDHVNDILAAILYLQETYHFEERYILVGHSCGATMALQVAMRRYWGAQYESTFALELNVVPPLAIIGIEGIYDIPALIKTHTHPAYRDFITGAFGRDEGVWRDASPTAGEFEASWEEGKLVVLVHSEDDELVGMEQPDLMWEALGAQGWNENGERRMKMVRLKGVKHDQIWEEGGEIAKAVEMAVEDLVARE